MKDVIKCDKIKKEKVKCKYIINKNNSEMENFFASLALYWHFRKNRVKIIEQKKYNILN